MGHLQNEACFRDASSSGTVRTHSHFLPWVPRRLTAPHAFMSLEKELDWNVLKPEAWRMAAG